MKLNLEVAPRGQDPCPLFHNVNLRDVNYALDATSPKNICNNSWRLQQHPTSNMPTELEELVEFLHHGNTQIRQIAAENLVGYSTAQPALFKRNQLEPVKDLKLLLKDYGPIATNALTMLVNISEDAEVLKSLSEDDAFLESLLRRVTVCQ